MNNHIRKEVYFIYLLQVRSILCGVCFQITNVIFIVFELIVLF